MNPYASLLNSWRTPQAQGPYFSPQPYDPAAAGRSAVAAAPRMVTPDALFSSAPQQADTGSPQSGYFTGRDGPSGFGGGGLPGTGGYYGQREREMQEYARGQAPFTAKGLMTAGLNAAGLLKGALGPLGMIGLGMSATNTTPDGMMGGLLGGVRNIPGYMGPRPGGLPPGMTRAQAQKEDRGHEAYGGGGRGAVDSHGQVRGGGTGSRGGGLTAGGPR